MKVKYLSVVFCLMFFISARGQGQGRIDSLRLRDSIERSRQMVIRDSIVRDSLNQRAQRAKWDSTIYARHPFLRFTDPISYPVQRRTKQGNESLFYSLIALLIFFALIRNSFTKYINDLFQTFFQFSVRHRQAKDQLVQYPLPSLLLNIFFVLSTALFLTLVLQYAGLGTDIAFWLLFVYCIIGLVAIYSVKFLSLKFFGWIFQLGESINVYIFIVFTTNKIIGVALLPFLVALAFSEGLFYKIAFGASVALIVGLFLYRYFLSYSSIHRQTRVHFFHFLLYLAAFEIAPLLLINKLLLRFLGETH